MDNSIVIAFVVALVAISPLAGMWKAHADARANGFRMRGIERGAPDSSEPALG